MNILRILFVLAIGSISLAGCLEEETTPVAAPELLEIGADLVMLDMENTITVEGVREAEVYADTAYFFKDSTYYLLKNPVLVLFTEKTGAQRARVVSEQGIMNMNTNELKAQGRVVLTVQEGNRRVESPELNYEPNGDRIWSDSLTIMYEEGVVSEGLGFTSDLDFRSMTVGPGSIRNIGGVGRDSIG